MDKADRMRVSLRALYDSYPLQGDRSNLRKLRGIERVMQAREAFYAIGVVNMVHHVTFQIELKEIYIRRVARNLKISEIGLLTAWRIICL